MGCQKHHRINECGVGLKMLRLCSEAMHESLSVTFEMGLRRVSKHDVESESMDMSVTRV